MRNGDSPPARRFLALVFPLLPIEQHRSRAPDAPAELPLTLVESVRGAQRLSAVCPRAEAMGLAPGLALADARARVPTLAAAPHDRAADARWLASLARAVLRYSPLVALAAPDGLTLEIGRTAHLFGGESALGGRIAQRAGRAGLLCHWALGPSPSAAQALARFDTAGADEAAALRALPAAALGLDPAATRALQHAGLATVGQVETRAPAALARRFGPGAMRALERLLGRASEPLTPWCEQRPLRLQARLAEPVLTVDGAMAALDTLLARAARRLERAHAGGRLFTATLERSDGVRHMLAVETLNPERARRRLGRLFAERLETLADPIDPGFGFDAVALVIDRLEPLAPAALPLDGRGQAAEGRLDQLVDRLAILAGRERVRRLTGADSHLPERANGWAPWADDQTPPPPPPGDVPRPLLLLDPPQPVDVMAEVPDGPPLRLVWRGRAHRIVAHEGPERLEPEWWRRPHGAAPARARDYYRVEDADGLRLWVCRAGGYDDDQPPRWYVHGLFA